MATKDYTVLALTSPNDQSYGATIKSALVYADKVQWCPVLLPTVDSHAKVLEFVVRYPFRSRTSGFDGPQFSNYLSRE